jgi:predicted ArsR family transcriptional regulator
MPVEATTISEPRQLTDPRAMRALAHPVRLALAELLTLDGPHTATQAAEKVGESPSNCSFHLRQLAKYGFVEETGDGTGRQRPWRMTQIGTQFSSVQGDTETAFAADTLSGVIEERTFRRWWQWKAAARSYPERWQRVGGYTDTVWWVTPAEQQQLDAQILELAMRYRDRLVDPERRPEGSQPMQFVGLAFPLRPPATGWQ